MKLLRYGPTGTEPGVLDNVGRIRDLSKILPDLINEHLSRASLARLAKLQLKELEIVPDLRGWVRQWVGSGISSRSASTASTMLTKRTYRWVITCH